MAISARNAGTWAYAASGSVTTTLPGHATGDMLLVRVAAKSSNIASLDITTATAGWTRVGQFRDGTTNSGNGTGSVQVAEFYKVAASASETNPTIDFSQTVTQVGHVGLSFQKGAAPETWDTPVGDGGGHGGGTSFSATIQSHVAVKSGDMVVAALASRDDTAFTVPTFTQAGVTFAAVTEFPATAGLDGSGADGSYDSCYRLATSGTSSAAAVVTATLAATETGSAWQTRLRVYQAASFTADAIIRKTETPSFTADAIIKATVTAGAPFPVVINAQASQNSGTTHTVTLPSGYQSGDLLIVVFGVDSEGTGPTISWPGGWSVLHANDSIDSTQGAYGARYRIADGSEGSSIAITTSNSQESVSRSLLIRSFDSTLNPFSSNGQAGTSSAPDPDQASPGWGTRNILFMAWVCMADAQTVSAYPTNYSLYQWTEATGTPVDSEAAALGTGSRELIGGLDNPGTFTLTGSAAHKAWTFAIAGAKGLPADAILLKTQSASFTADAIIKRPSHMSRWVQRSTPFSGSGTIQHAAYANGKWVAGGIDTNGKIITATTPDGTWTAATNPFSGNNSPWEINFGNGVWVAVAGGGELATATDPTGSGWTLRTSSYGVEDIFSVFFGNGVWVTTGTAKIATATDPTATWTQRTNPFSGEVYDVVYGNGVWVAVAESGEVATATDPTSTWTLRGGGVFGSDFIETVAYGDGYFVAGSLPASGAPDIYYATDPTSTWTKVSDVLGGVTGGIYGVFYDTTGMYGPWLVVGVSGKMATAQTPVGPWTVVPDSSFGSSVILDASASGGTWVAVGFDGKLASLVGLTADAVIAPAFSVSFTADAIVKVTVSASFTANAVVKTTVSASFAADAVLKKEQSASFTANAVVFKTQSASFTADAVIKREQAASLAANAVVMPVFTANAIIRKTMVYGPIVIDTFTEGSDTALSSHSSDSGHTYTHRMETDGAVVKADIDQLIFGNDNGLMQYSVGSALDEVDIRAVLTPENSGNEWESGVTARQKTTSAFDRLYGLTVSEFHIKAYVLAGGVNWSTLSSFVWSAANSPTTRIRFRVTGISPTTIRAKWWSMTQSEPEAWQLDTTNNTGGNQLTPGFVGVVGSSNQAVSTYIDDLNISLAAWLGLTADAVIKKTQTATFTADAVIKKEQTAPFVADAVISAGAGTVETSFTANAVVLKAQSASLTADAVIFRTQTATLTADAVMLRTQTSSLTADAVVKATIAASFTADAVIFRTQAASLTADAIKRITVAASFAGDAVIKKTQTPTFTADAVIFRIQVASVTADAVVMPRLFTDAIILRTQTATVTADAVIMPVFRAEAIVRAVQAASFTADAFVQGSGVVAFAADAVIFRTQAATLTADAIVLKTQTASLTADAVILRTQAASLTADAVIFRTQTAAFTSDAVVKREITAAFSADAIIRREQTATFTADAVLLRTQAASLTADAVIRIERTASLTSDAVILRTQTATPTADSVIFRVQTASATADAVIMPLFRADAVVLRTQAATLTGDAVIMPVFRADAIVRVERAASFTADAFIFGAGLTGFTADAVLRATIDRTISADAIVLRTQTAVLTADAVILRTQSATLTADAVIQREQTAVFAGDAVILRTQAASLSADAILLQTQSASLTADAFIQSAGAVSFAANAVIQREQTAALTADAVLRIERATSFTSDAMVRLPHTDTVTADAVVFRTQSQTLTGDAVLAQTQTASLTADAFIEVVQTATFTSDAVIVGGGVMSFTADAILTSPFNAAIQMDAWIVGLHIGRISASITAETIVATLSVVPWTRRTTSFSADAVVI